MPQLHQYWELEAHLWTVESAHPYLSITCRTRQKNENRKKMLSTPNIQYARACAPRLSECQRIKDRKDNLRKFIRHPPRLTQSHMFHSFLPHLFVTLQSWNRRAKPSCERLRDTNAQIITVHNPLTCPTYRPPPPPPIICHVWLSPSTVPKVDRTTRSLELKKNNIQTL